MRILAFDYEGGGTNPQATCPTQLGAAIMSNGQLEGDIEINIAPPIHYKSGKPTRDVSAYALRVQGKTLEQVEAGMSQQEACIRFGIWADDNDCRRVPIVAYNAAYDLATYREMLWLGGNFDRTACEYRAYPEILLGPWIDAFALARAYFQQRNEHLNDYKLDTVAAYFCLSRTSEKHGALEDAVLAYRVYEKLLSDDPSLIDAECWFEGEEWEVQT